MRWVGSVVCRNFIRSACASLSKIFLSQINVRFHAYDFTLSMWGSAVVNFKSEIRPTNTSGEVGM